MNLESILRLIEPLKNKISLVIGTASIKGVSDGPAIQEMQVGLLENEGSDGQERFAEYGFTSHPHSGSEAVVVFPGGVRSHGIIIAVEDRRYRLKGLEKGEVALYTDEEDKIVLKRNKTIEVTTRKFLVNATEECEINAANVKINASSKLQIDSPELSQTGKIHAEGNIISDGNVSDSKGSMDAMREAYNPHTHPVSGPTAEATPSQM